MIVTVQQNETVNGVTGKTVGNITPIITELELTTNRFDSPSKVTFKTVEQSGIAITEGACITVSDGTAAVFKGYVFTAKREMSGEVSYTAYDQLRYLKAKSSYTFVGMTLEQIISQIANDFGLLVGTLADTGYIFPTLIKENESCLDIIFGALSTVIVQTGKIFNFYDNAGALTLTEAKDMYSSVIFGDGSLVTDYTYKRDIDKDTYNRVKLVKPNKETGRTDVYEVEDTETQAKWGLLQYYEKVDENMNSAQIAEAAQQYLLYYNRVSQTFSFDALGVAGIRAGMIVPVKINDVASLGTTRLLIAEKVKHTYDGGDHVMKIEVKDFANLGENALYSVPT